jgi:transcriptional regulator with XRE-family HTH domain
MRITLEQYRMAKAALDLTVIELASLAKVSTNTLVRFERGERLTERTMQRVQAAFETAGIEFIPEDGGGVGVRLRKGAR